MSIENVARTTAGKLRPVCEFCDKRGRAVEPDDRGRIGLWDLAAGWSVAPYPPDFEHDDGSHGSKFQCAACQRKMDRDGVLHVTYARGDAIRRHQDRAHLALCDWMLCSHPAHRS